MPYGGTYKYILGLYRVLEEITSRNPNVLFESCAGGGGRFDPGTLYFSPQIWTSDNTDPIERLTIQFGTSLCYPVRYKYVLSLQHNGRSYLCSS